MSGLTRLIKQLVADYGDDVVRRVRDIVGDDADEGLMRTAAKNLSEAEGQNVMRSAPKPTRAKAAAPKPKAKPKASTPAAPAIIRNRSGSPGAVAQDVLSEAANKPKGASSYAVWRAANPGNGKLFDLSKLDRVPSVEQYQIPRHQPPRGPSDRIVSALADPNVEKGINETVERGVEGGGKQWYNTEPMLERMRGVMPSSDVAPSYARLMDIVAATSPRSKVTDNVRTGSYYNYLLANDLDIPDKPAKGYGSIAQSLHRDNVRGLEERGGWDIFKNPKPASFSSNLQGNQRVATIDTHNFRLPGILSGDPRFLETTISELGKSRGEALNTLKRHYPELPEDVAQSVIRPRKDGGVSINYKPRDWVNEGYASMDDMLGDPASWTSKPRSNEYGYYENWQQDQAAKMGLSPAQYQASMWLGGGDTTGLGSAAEPFLGTLEARVRYTADRLGIDPEKVLDMMLRGEIPLLAEGGRVDLDGLASRYED